ncbi:hypothetical protein CSC82_03360 [Rhodobacteraceae bacterium 4F10]|nr:hypothetical protein CSC82_03360 [Rhodobacteraceae bacterium 4F10]
MLLAGFFFWAAPFSLAGSVSPFPPALQKTNLLRTFGHIYSDATQREARHGQKPLFLMTKPVIQKQGYRRPA